MPLLWNQPGPCARQVSGRSPQGQPTLNVLARRAYRRLRNEWAPDATPSPLVEEPKFGEDDATLEADADVFPFKPFTDVVVKGAAYDHTTTRSGVGSAALFIGQAGKALKLFGSRRATLDAAGHVVFSAPKRFERIPLLYKFAYGGCDETAQKRAGYPEPGLFGRIVPPDQATPETANPYRYPRNPAGRGYMVEATREALESVRLPNIEDPQDLLTPERLASGGISNWPRQPLPAGMDWVDYGWFPRIGYFGVVPSFEPTAQPFSEVARGFAPANIGDPLDQTVEKAFRFTCGASLGLQVPHLRGGEAIRLENLSPRSPLETWRLPMPPRMFTDGRKGKLNPTVPALHTAILHPDDLRLELIWRGTATALRPYLPDELAKMPFRVEWEF